MGDFNKTGINFITYSSNTVANNSRELHIKYRGSKVYPTRTNMFEFPNCIHRLPCRLFGFIDLKVRALELLKFTEKSHFSSVAIVHPQKRILSGKDKLKHKYKNKQHNSPAFIGKN